MDLIKALTWQSVALLMTLLGAVVALVIWGHQSLTGISTFIGAVLAALVLYRQSAAQKQAERIESNTNGSNEALRRVASDKDAQMIQMAQDHARTVAQLTAQLPQGSPLPKALVDDEHPTT